MKLSYEDKLERASIMANERAACNIKRRNEMTTLRRLVALVCCAFMALSVGCESKHSPTYDSAIELAMVSAEGGWEMGRAGVPKDQMLAYFSSILKEDEE